MGGDALSPDSALSESIASTSRWNAADYARVGRFVADLGEAALDLLDPKLGERILDIGCGDGALTHKIVERGADVVGVDNSPELVAAAQAIGLDVHLMDAADMAFDAEFDAAFSNAALHWMLDKERVANATFRALKSGARYAGEMGGEGNLTNLREALDAELVARGYPPPLESSNWYPSVEEFAAVYETAGFTDRAPDAHARRDRPVGHDLPPRLARPRRRARRGARRDRRGRRRERGNQQCRLRPTSLHHEEAALNTSRHSREGGNLAFLLFRVPAFAGMTKGGHA